jgi:serine protease Do
MKNTLNIVLIALIVAGNGVIAGLRLEASDRLNEDKTQITALSTANTDIQSGIDELQAGRVQAQASLTALQAAAAKLTSQTATGQAKYAAVIAAIKPAVVKINATGPGLRGYSTGVLVSSSGYMLTVLHSVNGASSIKITLSSGEQFDATMVASDAAANLALLKMTTTRTDLPAAVRGTIAAVLTGQTVISAGFPLSVELPGPVTFTAGIVSALRTATNFYYIQSDADIAPGSGGGGLFTLDGKLVAISSLAQADGIYLYIPIDAAASLLKNVKAA